MTPATYIKTYPSAAHCARALGNYAWLRDSAAPLILPEIRAVSADRITFAYIDGRHAAAADLPVLAAHLGDAHGAAWITSLHQAHLERPYTSPDGHRIPDAVTPRRALLTPAALAALTDGPAAFYKDANLRNTLVTAPGRFITLDVDQLTLAPFGYDLAKLIVSLAMTHGPLPDHTVHTALARYNAAAARHDRRLGRTSLKRFLQYTQIHATLTGPYLGRHGYQHLWQQPAEPAAKAHR